MLIVNRVVTRGGLGALALVVSVLAAFALLVAPTAFGDAGGPASCMGHEASALSPPGSNEEFLAGMRGFNRFFRENFPGTPSGQFIRTISHLHEGSHAACDEALEG